MKLIDLIAEAILLFIMPVVLVVAFITFVTTLTGIAIFEILKKELASWQKNRMS
jgi:hypothetical protein